jgi:hypothetical protein
MKEMFETKKEVMAMLDLEKADITAKIPKSKHAGAALSPAAQA